MPIIRGIERLLIKGNQDKDQLILATKPRPTIHCPASEACLSFTWNNCVAHLSVQAEWTDIPWHPRDTALWELKPLRVVAILYFRQSSISLSTLSLTVALRTLREMVSHKPGRVFHLPQSLTVSPQPHLSSSGYSALIYVLLLLFCCLCKFSYV